MRPTVERPPTFTRYDDGRILVDYWPDCMRISLAVIEQAPSRYIRRDGDLITITVDNGAATYRVEVEEPGGLLLCQAIERGWWHGEPK